MKQMQNMQTYDLVHPPPDAQIINSHYICKVKRNKAGEAVEHKVRWVVGGNAQVYISQGLLLLRRDNACEE